MCCEWQGLGRREQLRHRARCRDGGDQMFLGRRDTACQDSILARARRGTSSGLLAAGADLWPSIPARGRGRGRDRRSGSVRERGRNLPGPW